MKCVIDTHDKNKGSFPRQGSLRNSSLSNSQRSRMALPSFKFTCAACPKTPNSSAASQGTCGDQFAPRLYLRDKARDRCQHAYNNATNEGSFLDMIATFRW